MLTGMNRECAGPSAAVYMSGYMSGYISGR